MTVLTQIDDGAAAARAVASLRAACEVLTAAGDRVSAVSVSGSLPSPGGAITPVLAAAHRLAAEHALAVHIRLDGEAFEIRFSRSAVRDGVDGARAS